MKYTVCLLDVIYEGESQLSTVIYMYCENISYDIPYFMDLYVFFQ